MLGLFRRKLTATPAALTLVTAARQDWRARWDFGLYTGMDPIEAVDAFARQYFHLIIPASRELARMEPKLQWFSILQGIQQTDTLSADAFTAAWAEMFARYGALKRRPEGGAPRR